jgi:hypothetical protein
LRDRRGGQRYEDVSGKTRQQEKEDSRDDTKKAEGQFCLFASSDSTSSFPLFSSAAPSCLATKTILFPAQL